ncbi:hypothetical protein [uncultured Flavobacterium sp.]|uniref:hypothetical protein n=1 Tax=uncultured Flavobacterium sp. TaxID=165435 RepID=UPI0030ED66AB|tara:strand:+ start:99982 stop:100698 length:717 start_codon:yes stop_codon:yes gene_type:complete
MKKITLLVASLLLMSNVTIASEKNVFTGNDEGYRFITDYRDADPIVFKERGIEFFIFLDGQFDFNTQATTAPTRNRTENMNRTHGAPGVRTVSVANSYYGPVKGVKVEHDYQGRVRRVGNVFINYDAYGRVKRVGSVYMKYNSFALKQVGGMKIFYNRRGQIMDIVGYVNSSSYGNHYDFDGHGFGNGNGHGNGNNNGYDNDSDDEDFYYYKKDGSKVKMDDDDVIEIKRDEKERKRK